MKLKGLVWFFTIALIVISLWELSYTWVVRSYESKVKAQAERQVKKANPNLPADLIPYWDHNVPGKKTAPRDVSAAAITASALYELSGYSKEAFWYRTSADKILSSIIKNYRAPLNTHHGFILLHSTGHKPANSEVDVPIIYDDYYYIEALLRRKKM